MFLRNYLVYKLLSLRQRGEAGIYCKFGADSRLMCGQKSALVGGTNWRLAPTVSRLTIFLVFSLIPWSVDSTSRKLLVPCYSPASFPVFSNGRPFTDELNFPFYTRAFFFPTQLLFPLSSSTVSGGTFQTHSHPILSLCDISPCQTLLPTHSVSPIATHLW